MMLVLALLLAILLPMILGAVVLLSLEGTTRVLSWLERLTLGFVSGMTLLTYAAFIGNVAMGLPFSTLGFLGTWVVLVLIALACAYVRGVRIEIANGKWRIANMSLLEPGASSQFPPTPRLRGAGALRNYPLWSKILVGIFVCTVIIRICMGAMVAATTPPYFDDTLNNWNLRGKLYYATQTYTLLLPMQKPGEVPSALSAYPPMVPLAKAFTATLAGTWSDGLVDILHVSWFIAVLLIVFAFLRRHSGTLWACVGAGVLGSLPLFLMHGVNAYSDIAMSGHIAAALTFLCTAVMATSPRERETAFRIAIFFAALFPFVKNEGLLLYLTTFAAFASLSIIYLLWQKHMEKKEALRLIVFGVACAALLILPWLMFKWMNNMPFGNAKAVSNLQVGWQQGVLFAVTINTFFEGNWNILFALFLLLLGWQWKMAWRTPVVILVGFILLLWVAQILLFLFTSLSYEALMQTGYARGLIHLVPLVVCVTITLLSEIVMPNDQAPMTKNS